MGARWAQIAWECFNSSALEPLCQSLSPGRGARKQDVPFKALSRPTILCRFSRSHPYVLTSLFFQIWYHVQHPLAAFQTAGSVNSLTTVRRTATSATGCFCCFWHSALGRATVPPRAMAGRTSCMALSSQSRLSFSLLGPSGRLTRH